MKELIFHNHAREGVFYCSVPPGKDIYLSYLEFEKHYGIDGLIIKIKTSETYKSNWIFNIKTHQKYDPATAQDIYYAHVYYDENKNITNTDFDELEKK